MVSLRALAAQIAGMFVVFAGLLFVAAGTLAWLPGWAYLTLFFAFVVAISAWLLRHDPALLAERLTGIGSAGQKTWDKVFFGFAATYVVAWLALMPLDAVRWHWSRMPGVLQVAGALLLLGSFYAFFLVFRENAYLSPAVRIQDDRGQSVVSTGPYAHVRHPMYAAAMVWAVGTALLLGSWYGLLATLGLMAGIAVRAVLEERTLRTELPGYAAYMERVRHRIIPGVW